jgi:hypothetical protein
MPRTAFRFDAPEPKLMEVNLSWWGREQYILDGVVLLQQWTPSFSSARQFTVGTRLLRIEVTTGLHDYCARAFLDGELYIDELFPEYRAMLESLKRQSSWRSAIVPGIIGGALAAVIAALWRSGLLAQ